MSKFIPEKVFIEYKDGIGIYGSKERRRYTLTHSDKTGDLFLTIGSKYDYEKVNKTRDEVFAKWSKIDNKDVLEVFVQVNIDSNVIKTAIRNRIFRRELGSALKSIIYGDREFLKRNPALYNVPVVVNFKSNIPRFNKTEEWGKVKDYIIENNK